MPYADPKKDQACKKAWAEANREKVLASKRKWREKNFASAKAKEDEWKAANKEHQAAYNKLWRIKNRERTLATAAAWLERNKEYKRAKDFLWRRANRDVMTANLAKYRASKIKATPAWADLDKIAIVYAEAAAMTKMMGEPYHVDHIVPLRGKTVCGLHVHNNLQVLHGIENIKKSNRHWPDMP